jgi:hypothetical protein
MDSGTVYTWKKYKLKTLTEENKIFIEKSVYWQNPISLIQH